MDIWLFAVPFKLSDRQCFFEIGGRRHFYSFYYFGSLVPNRFRGEILRRLHGNMGQKLHQMVLHEIAYCSGLFIKCAPSVDATLLQGRNLNMINEVFVPQRFKNTVGKADSQKVLHSFFAKIMVNAVYLRQTAFPKQLWSAFCG